MGIAYNTSIVRSNSVLHLDAANIKSYPGSGSTWSDLSGNGNNGTLTNAPTYSSANNGSIVFDGTNDHILLPTNFFSFPSLTTFTISLWFKSTQTTGGTLFGQQSTANYDTAGGFVPVIYLRTNGLIRVEPFWTASESNNILSTNALNNGVWHNVTTTFNAGTNILYINGILNSQRTGLTLTSYTSLYYYLIGAGRAGRGIGTNVFAGDISNFVFYSTALTAAEITQNFNALRGRYNV
jgi:hypothetical protein